jgi:hypothetical protein
MHGVSNPFLKLPTTRAVPGRCPPKRERFNLDALTSAVPLNVDLDTTLTVVAGNLYRLLALKLPRYQNATPDRIWRHFLDATGTLHITPTGITCALNLRSHHPVLIDAGLADLNIPIPWWNGRTLRFRFPPR